jgi:transcriptional regulator with XRE-family HTH domain
MNIARASILSWEKSLTEPDLLQRMMLARIFNVSYLGLLGNKEMQGIRNDEMSYGKYTRNGFL